MRSVRVITGMIMPRGWHFIQGDRKITGTSFENLVEEVIQFRLNNKISVGDVVSDIEKFICETYPRQCHEAPQEVTPTPIQKTRNVDHINAYANENFGKSHAFVTPDEANRRAEICRQCQHNVKWEGDCSSCVTNARRLLSLIRENRDVVHYRNLHLCDTTLHDNRTAVWLPINKRNSNPPSNCWQNE